jgi:Copper type II ascorbate-dependent monooxygenase, C-terminal domain
MIAAGETDAWATMLISAASEVAMNKLILCFASVSVLGLGCGSGGGGGGGDDDVDSGMQQPQIDGAVVVQPKGEMLTMAAGTAMIPAGAEEEWCEVVALPSNVDIKVNHIRLTINAGVSHHAIVQLITPGSPWAGATVGTKIKQGGCSIPGSAVPILIGTQRPVVEFEFPPDVYYPIAANQKVLLNYHYINTTSSAQPVDMKVELWHDDGPRNIKAGSLFYNWTNFAAIGAGMTSTQRHDCAPFATPKTIMTLNGHFHKMGVKFEAFKVTAGVDTKLYENVDWDNPKYEVYTPPLEIAAGESLSFACTWTNTGGMPVSFGIMGKDEMCILGGYIYPSDSLTVECGR